MFPNKLSTITFHFKKKKNGDISIILKIFCTLNNWHISWHNLIEKLYEYLSIRCNENNF